MNSCCQRHRLRWLIVAARDDIYHYMYIYVDIHTKRSRPQQQKQTTTRKRFRETSRLISSRLGVLRQSHWCNRSRSSRKWKNLLGADGGAHYRPGHHSNSNNNCKLIVPNAGIRFDLDCQKRFLNWFVPQGLYSSNRVMSGFLAAEEQRETPVVVVSLTSFVEWLLEWLL